MKIEVLVTTMRQKDISKYYEMNLQTDAVIANQSDKCEFVEKNIGGSKVRFITTDTRGVSINRNVAITYSKGDIIVFADDDMLFLEEYAQIIITAFKEKPDADAIKFYCESTNPERPLSFKKPLKLVKAKKRELMSAGVIGLAVRRDFLIKNSIVFESGIGPGQEIICGEDNTFFNSLYQKKANIYVSPQLISYVKQDGSSWFESYDDKFFYSNGYIYDCVYGKLAPLAIIRRVIKFDGTMCSLSKKQIFISMMKGHKKHLTKKD